MKDFSKTKQLAVKQIAEGNIYKKIHIQYNTKNGGDKLPIKKGAEIILNYSYEVPTSLWGSYLNRYSTYWCEDMEVVLCCNEKKLTEDIIKVYIADHTTGDPFITEDSKNEFDTHKGETLCNIKLPNKESGKYIIRWDADNLFELTNLNTDMTVDHSQQTQY